ncbi:MAG: tRNA (N6-threonylcarbamoyladenosine(37)-N6)-methyltransferase TrmO [Nitrospirae bacterium GWD2_57_9]|nr:MAG: tRNA (N6-threonylcarbamoyladenosine(37)-N6)-methyltransferase TrmO [Nitrospirae bacterium GWD2_57_9]
MDDISYILKPVGFVRSSLRTRDEAPKQGIEGAPDAWIEIVPAYREALDGISEGSEVIVMTWLHLAHRRLLKVHPRGDTSRPPRGVFSTRSPDRPNPIGLHRVKVLAIEGGRIKVGPLEALDGTPVIDIKSVMHGSGE